MGDGGRGRDRTYASRLRVEPTCAPILNYSCGISSCKTVSVTKSVTNPRKRCAVGALIDRGDQLIGLQVLIRSH
jgi:hypothetical protein